MSEDVAGLKKFKLIPAPTPSYGVGLKSHLVPILSPLWDGKNPHEAKWKGADGRIKLSSWVESIDYRWIALFSRKSHKFLYKAIAPRKNEIQGKESKSRPLPYVSFLDKKTSIPISRLLCLFP